MLNPLLPQVVRTYALRAARNSPAFGVPTTHAHMLIQEASTNIEKELSKFSLADQKTNINRFPFGSDTGTPLSRVVVDSILAKDAVLRQTGASAPLIEQERQAIESLFLPPAQPRPASSRFFTAFAASTSQANKTAFLAIANINSANAEVALASTHSHVFSHEVGQPAVGVQPADSITGKLTIADLKAAQQGCAGKEQRIKLIHLDQPTKGDYIYSSEEISAITKWAHAQNIPVSMDIERLVNYLPRSSKSYYDMTTACGVDVVMFGQQKNGGARSSAAVVLNTAYLHDPKDLARRCAAFQRRIGDITDTPTFVSAGWKAMVQSDQYLKNAAAANEHADRIALVMAQYQFGEEKLVLQNYPLTTNMIFARLPRQFIDLFNQNNQQDGFTLSPDRYGITRIVTSCATTAKQTDDFIERLNKTYEQHTGKQRPDPIGLKMLATNENANDAAVGMQTLTPDEAIALSRQKAQALLGNLAPNPAPSPEASKQPKVLARLISDNGEGYHPPYGDDQITAQAREQVLKLFGKSNAAVAFASSKNQAINVIMQLLEITNNSQIIVSANNAAQHTTHIRNVKIVEPSNEDFAKTGKLDPKVVDGLLRKHNSPGQHVPLLTGVFIQQPTSNGYVYSKAEIKEIADAAHRHQVPVIMTTNRFSYYLADKGESYADYAEMVDCVTVGHHGLGGSNSSAVVVLDSTYLRLRPEEIEIVLNRTLKEEGGKQSGSSILNVGWIEMVEHSLWRAAANQVNQARNDVIACCKQLGLALRNDMPHHNILEVFIPPSVEMQLLSKGYKFDKRDGFSRIKITLADIDSGRVTGLIFNLKSAIATTPSHTQAARKHSQGQELKRPVPRTLLHNSTQSNSRA